MKIVLTGAGGYGQTYLKTLDDLGMFGSLVGIADPFAAGSSYYPRFAEAGVLVYDTLEQFYAKHSADLAIVSSPIHYHEQHTLAALNNGSHVLCEKPVAATVAQALNMRRAADERGLKLGVGFQWSASSRMRAFKADILNGRFGAPVSFKSMLYWPRPDSYYNTSAWKGRVTADGLPVNDSVATNATAHYLHHMLFLAGSSMDASAMPEYIRGAVFRFRDIESYDTCILAGALPGGARFHYGVSHSCGGGDSAMFEFQFTDCTVYMDITACMVLRRGDGTLEHLYGDVPEDGLAGKLLRMITAIEDGTPVPCGIDTVLPHLTVTTTIAEQFIVQNFSDNVVIKTDDPAGAGVKGLREALKRCYDNELLPDECDGFPMQDARVTEARLV